eukprot:705714-Rhodomonas_salina.1
MSGTDLAYELQNMQVRELCKGLPSEFGASISGGGRGGVICSVSVGFWVLGARGGSIWWEGFQFFVGWVVWSSPRGAEGASGYGMQSTADSGYTLPYGGGLY